MHGNQYTCKGHHPSFLQTELVPHKDYHWAGYGKKTITYLFPISMLKAHWDLKDKFSNIAGAAKDPLKVSYAQTRANSHD